MICPRLADLPEVPSDRKGWPWTKEYVEGAGDLEGQDWPKLSVVVPSYNQGAFLEETLRSILLQGYPDLELFVMDGGSDDESVATIEKYGNWIEWWVSGKDGGQAAAINKGFERATGEILNWINSDDVFCPGAFHAAAQRLAREKGKAALIYGNRLRCDTEGGSSTSTFRHRDCDSRISAWARICRRKRSS